MLWSWLQRGFGVTVALPWLSGLLVVVVEAVSFYWQVGAVVLAVV